MQGVILAAGRGERMKPLTDELPKPLLTINGTPVIDQIITLLTKVGVSDISIVAGYLKDELINHLEGQNLKFCFQEKQSGTANALLQAKNLLKGDFISLAADTIFKPTDLFQMIESFKKNKPDVLVGLRQVQPHELQRRSTVNVKCFKIIQIVEKPLPGRELSNISAMPIFIFRKSIWPYVTSVKKSQNGKYEIASAIQAAIEDHLEVNGFYFSWAQDITYPSDVS